MRRFLLMLFLVTLPSWSQPAQPQAQPPIVVKFEMSLAAYPVTHLQIYRYTNIQVYK